MVAIRPHTLTTAHLHRFRLLFVGRHSDFAVQLPTGRYRRVGRPLTNNDLIAHLLGHWTIGSYVINEAGLCRFAVFDADRKHGLTQLLTIQRQLADDGLVSYLELSRRGGHLRVFFARPFPASQVRDWFLPYCPSDVELYPKQGEGSGYGSLIRLPLGRHQVSGEWYPFVHWNGRQLVPVTAGGLYEQLAWLVQVITNAVPGARLKPLRAPAKLEAAPHQSLATNPLRSLSSSSNAIHAWCASQDPFEVIGAYVSLDAQGLGSCPFGAHHVHGTDRHPSFKVYRPTKAGGSCWYCYTWQRGGNVFDFLCLWYGVDARTMWHRIQEGQPQEGKKGGSAHATSSSPAS